ncbi:MAG: hypothetical protein OXH68_08910 [Gammaproteobacteria bacterium]|nr:hypothetical protein [Gammaproteobacteria bacterium]
MGTAHDVPNNRNGAAPDGRNCAGCHLLDPAQGLFGTGGNASHGGEVLILKVPHQGDGRAGVSKRHEDAGIVTDGRRDDVEHVDERLCQQLREYALVLGGAASTFERCFQFSKHDHGDGSLNGGGEARKYLGVSLAEV